LADSSLEGFSNGVKRVIRALQHRGQPLFINFIMSDRQQVVVFEHALQCNIPTTRPAGVFGFMLSSLDKCVHTKTSGGEAENRAPVRTKL
jgi:hypothetical protein